MQIFMKVCATTILQLSCLLAWLQRWGHHLLRSRRARWPKQAKKSQQSWRLPNCETRHFGTPRRSQDSSVFIQNTQLLQNLKKKQRLEGKWPFLRKTLGFDWTECRFGIWSPKKAVPSPFLLSGRICSPDFYFFCDAKKCQQAETLKFPQRNGKQPMHLRHFFSKVTGT